MPRTLCAFFVFNMGMILIERLPKQDLRGRRRWGLFKCDYGNEKICYIGDVRDGKTISCGCYNKTKTAMLNYKHGLTNTNLHSRWRDIIKRCYNQNASHYHDYGGRGITVCNEWLNDFKKFYDWSINNGYEKHLHIDRINNNGNYEPSNCRWVTNAENACNKRNNRIFEINGKSLNIAQWARELNIPDYVLRHRLKRGWTPEKTFTTPLIKHV